MTNIHDMSAQLKLRTWRCAPLIAPPLSQPPLPPFLIYQIGLEKKMLRTFELVADALVGDVYVVQRLECGAHGAPCPAPQLKIALRQRRTCVSELIALPRAVPRFASSHYSLGPARYKLNLLDHVPRTLRAIALLDSDTLCVGACSAKLQPSFDTLAARNGAFLAASTGAGVRRTCAGNVTCRALSTERSIYGEQLQRTSYRQDEDGRLNSGVVLFDLPRLRAFERQHCPHRDAWWHCVLDTEARGYAWSNADQGVWSRLVERWPQTFVPLPCGIHAASSVLIGIGVRLGIPTKMSDPDSTPMRDWRRHTRASSLQAERTLPTVCNGSEASGSGRLGGRAIGGERHGKLNLQAVLAATDCDGDPLAAARRVAFTHGAGHHYPLARAIALRLTYCMDAPPTTTHSTTSGGAAERGHTLSTNVPRASASPLLTLRAACDARSLVPCRCFASTRSHDRRILDSHRRCAYALPMRPDDDELTLPSTVS
jgi:hypothetical protein